MKNYLSEEYFDLTKLLRRMKATFVVFVLFTSSLLANPALSQNARVNITLKKARVIEVIKAIESQTDYLFVYDQNRINLARQVDVDADNQTVAALLGQVFEGTDVQYSMVGTNIVLVPQQTIQQQVLGVSGRVTDNSGASLPGVSVVVKGTTNGTITDVNGEFYLTLNEEDKLLVFSFIGMKDQQVQITAGSRYDIQMQYDILGLEEVVVVGYGTMKKSDLTGSVASVRVREIQNTPLASVEKALQGKVAGVQIFNSGNDDPQGGATVRIRGASSINASKAPLLVVDGFPFGDAGGINSINPNNIKSIEVLKDASATAIYGSKGANGVIMVTTKDGSENLGFSVNVDSKMSVSDFSQDLDYWTDVLTMAKLENEAFINQGIEPLYRGAKDALGVYYPSLRELENGEWPYYTDWADYVFRKPLTQDHNVSIQNSNESTSYNLNVGYYSGLGMQYGEDYDKYTMDVTFRYQFNKKMSILTKTGYMYGKRYTSPGLDYGRNPLFPVYEGDGSYFKSHAEDYGNIMALRNERTNHNQTKEQYLQTKFDWEILPGLKHSTQLNYRHSFYEWTSFEPTIYTLEGDKHNGIGKIQTNNTDYIIGDSYLTYNNQFGNHQLNLMSGVSYETEVHSGKYLEARDFTNEILREENLSSGSTRYLNNSYSNPKMASALGRFNYTYQDKYLLTFTSRLDGSSRFGENRRWGYFPSGAIAWRASEESFIQSLNVFSNLKLRLTYGISGNQGIPSGLIYERFGQSYYYTEGEEKIIHGIGYIVSRGRYAEWGGIANKSLGWEETAQWDFGFDASFFDNRLHVVFDYYEKTTTDLLRQKYLAPNTGFDEIWVNDGEVLNKGFEITLSGNPFKTKALAISSDIIFSYNRNKVTDIGTREGSGYTIDEFGNKFTPYGGARVLGDQFVNVLAIDKPLNVFYGYKVDGIIQEGSSNDEMKRPGEFNYVDLNNDGEITSADRTIIGDPNPDFTASWSFTLSHKSGIDLSFLFYGVYGNDIFSLRKLNAPSLQQDRWTPDNPTNERPSLRAGRQYLVSDWFIEDGSFLRLQNVNLGYTFNEPFFKEFFKQGRVYFNATNLFTLEKTYEYDVEVGENGVGNTPYPRVSAYTIGLKLKF